jgi:hypothetical protein
MIRAIFQDAAALIALALFGTMILVWCAIIQPVPL